jgi:hypothetical protein
MQSKALQEFLEAHRREVGLALRDETIALLTRKTRKVILESDATEHDRKWAIPELTAEEESLTVATWRGAGRWTAKDYQESIQRLIPAQRPSAAFLENWVRWACVDEVSKRLMYEEAVRRGIDRDWWVERALQDFREERRLRRVREEITSRIELENSTVDSLASALRASRGDLFRHAERAWLVRFDLRTREAALEERHRILKAGGAMARLDEVLKGDFAFRGAYHIIQLTPDGVTDPRVETAIFAEAPGTLRGPFELLGNWTLLECRSVEPARPMAPEEIRDHVRTQLIRGEAVAALSSWIATRRQEMRVTINEDALGALGPGI